MTASMWIKNGGKDKKRLMGVARGLLAIMGICCCLVPLVAKEDISVPYLYRSWDARDPFTALASTKVEPQLMIHELTLTGIINIRGGKIAIFKRYKGPVQTYQLRGSRLYGKDGKIVSAVRGKVLDAKTVLLIQGDEEIPFKLGDALNQD